MKMLIHTNIMTFPWQHGQNLLFFVHQVPGHHTLTTIPKKISLHQTLNHIPNDPFFSAFSSIYTQKDP